MRKARKFPDLVEGYAKRKVNEDDYETDIRWENNGIAFKYNFDEFAGYKVDDKEYIALTRAFLVHAKRKDFISELNQMVFDNGVYLDLFPECDINMTVVNIVCPIQISYGRKWYKEIDGCVKYLVRVKDEILETYQIYNSQFV